MLVYYYEYITGFSFLDKVGALLWEIGHTDPFWSKVETVELEESEVIIGVVAKFEPGFQSIYSDF